MESRSPRCLRRVCDVHSTGNNKNAAKNIMHGMFQLRLLRFNSVFAVNQISEVIPPWGKSVFDCLISSKFCAKTIIRLTDLLTPFNRTNEIFARCMKTVRELDGKSSRLRSVMTSSYHIKRFYVSTTKRCQCVANHYKSIEEHFSMLWETLTNVGIPLKMHWKSLSMHWKSIDNALKNGSTVVSVKGRFRK